MRVPYRSCGRSRYNDDILYEVAGRVRFCCVSMCRFWNVLVGFGVKGHPRTNSCEVNLFTQIPQADGGIVVGLSEITYCPWCSEMIETCREK